MYRANFRRIPQLGERALRKVRGETRRGKDSKVAERGAQEEGKDSRVGRGYLRGNVCRERTLKWKGVDRGHLEGGLEGR